MQWFCWHMQAKISLGFLCLFLVCNTGRELNRVLLGSPKLVLNLFLHSTASGIRREHKKEKQVAVLATAELPAKSVDLAAINLTELVNDMLNTALRGTKKLFSLLSVTSYSSFAFHKVSVTIYNISNVKNVDPGKFPMRYCYCLNNVTNDLADFTALLVDIIGNSTSYLTEIFKSTSILSVRQSNDSDCIFICVMTGQTGRNLSDFWEVLDKSPVINYTFSGNTSSDPGKYILGNRRNFVKLQEDPNKTVDSSAEHVWTFKMCCWCHPSVSPASPDTSIPVAQKGEENPTTRFPPWPKTAGAKGSGFPSPHVDSSRSQGTAGPPLTAGESSSPSPPLQPITRSICSFIWGKIGPCSSQTPLRPGLCSHFFASNTVSRLVKRQYIVSSLNSVASRDQQTDANRARPGVTLKLYSATIPVLKLMWKAHQYYYNFILLLYLERKSRLPALGSRQNLGCPQAILKESHVTSPPVTLIVQKINPCVMELCRFFQLCLCVGQRRYSRKEAMRYCVEYYSWFLKNASYICERAKRVAYSHTLKQKCLKNICTSV
ncbi:HHLA1 protein, partial [Zapornia atra]|nr:HHLA1 protein [Zapornia atra]